MISEKSTRLPRRMIAMGSALVLVALVWISGGGQAAATRQASSDPRPTIVLVHGDWADASSWNGVIQRLQDRGFTVVAPPNTLRGPSQDAPYLASYLQTIPGPIVLVAHSYGGFVITNAATGNPNVKALVYIDAFAPDENETALDLVGGTTSCVNDDGAFNQVPFSGGVDLYLRWEANPPYAGFTECFANGVDEETARLLAAGAATRVGRAVHRSVRRTRVEDDPVVGAPRDAQDNVIPPALQEDDVRARRRPRLQGQGWAPEPDHTSGCGRPGHPVGGRGDDVIAREGNAMKIVVIGGSGLIGSKLVEKLREAGHDPLAASPDSGVDTLTGEGLAEALEDARVVVDVSNAPVLERRSGAGVLPDLDPQHPRRRSDRSVSATTWRCRSSAPTGCPTAGTSGPSSPRRKRSRRRPCPYTIVRATQFFEFIGRIADSNTDGETVRVPPVLVQPEAADDVAAALAVAAVGAPVNGTVELAGPERFRLDELTRRVLNANGDARRVTADGRARYFGATLDDRSLIPGDDASIAPTRFEDWLSQTMVRKTRPKRPRPEGGSE